MLNIFAQLLMGVQLLVDSKQMQETDEFSLFYFGATTAYLDFTLAVLSNNFLLTAAHVPISCIWYGLACK